MIPLLHDFTGQRVLVFGGGTVGARKARRFAREATAVVVAPSFVDEADARSTPATDPGGATDPFAGAERVRAAPGPAAVEGWLERVDPTLVVAATNDAPLNAAIEEAAREEDVLVNRADRSDGHLSGDVAVPATVRDDPVVVAVATGATSPALSRYLRGTIEATVDGAGGVAAASAAVREDLRERGVDPEDRRTALRAVVASDRVWAAARRSSETAAAVAATVAADALSGEE